MNRIEREKKVVAQMISLYCRRNHHPVGSALCDGCADLLGYAYGRLDRCPKGCDKSSCRKCEIHCYSPRYKAMIRDVMRYSGPRMIIHHPLAAIRHLWSEI